MKMEPGMADEGRVKYRSAQVDSLVSVWRLLAALCAHACELCAHVCVGLWLNAR